MEVLYKFSLLKKSRSLDITRPSLNAFEKAKQKRIFKIQALFISQEGQHLLLSIDERRTRGNQFIL